jgi:hypothetical protein
MNQQRARAVRLAPTTAALASKEQILASPIDACQRPSDENFRQRFGDGPPQPMVVDFNRRDRLTDCERSDSPPGGFDFGKLGHRGRYQ